MQSLQTSLIPLFMVTKSPLYLSYPHNLKCAVLDLLFYFPVWSAKLTQSVMASIQSCDSSITFYLLDIVTAKKQDFPSETRFSIQLSLMLGLSAARLDNLRKEHAGSLVFLDESSKSREMMPIASMIDESCIPAILSIMVRYQLNV